MEEETEEEILERSERDPPEILVQMRGIWGGYVRHPMKPQQERLQKVMEDDPKGFAAQLAGLEKQYMATLEALGPRKKEEEAIEHDAGTEKVEELLAEEWKKLEGML